jgi:hypothetical protein
MAQAKRVGLTEVDADGLSWLVVGDDEKYALADPAAEDFDAVREHLLAQKRQGPPVQAILEQLAPLKGTPEYSLLLERLYADIARPAVDVTAREVADFLDSETGRVFGLHRQLARQDQSITPERARELYRKALEHMYARVQGEAKAAMLRRLGLGK